MMDNIETKGLTPIVHNEENILEVNGLKKYFPIKGGFFNSVVGQVKALDGISFHIKRGTTMGLVGESGCGKTTAGRTILRLNGGKTAGEVLFNGKEVYDIPKNELNDLRVKMQIIFQDPFSSLSPRLPVGEIIGEAVREHNLVPRGEYHDYIDQVMDNCGLQPFHKDSSDTGGVMYLGNIVEFGTTEELFANPLHPYTKALFSAIPIPDPDAKMKRIILEGSIPSPANPPAGCKFHTRCAQCMEKCKTQAPERKDMGNGHYVCCHLYDDK